MQLELSERQKELATGLFIVVIFGFGFGLGEGALRLLQLAKFGTPTTVERSKRFYIDQETGLRLPRPNTVHGKIHINSLGYRSPEIPVPKPSGTVRLAFVGSSTTYDANVDDNATWSHVTWRNVQSALPNCRVDYLNAGVPGYYTAHMEKNFRFRVARAQPDVVIVLASDVNADADKLAQRSGVHNSLHYTPSWLARHSLLWTKVEKNIEVIKRQRAAHLEAGKLRFDPRTLSRDFEVRLEKLVTTAKGDEGRLVVLLANVSQLRVDQTPAEQVRAANTALFYMPYMSIQGMIRSRDEYNRVIRSVAARTGALYVDPTPSIPGDRMHFADSAHFQAPGSRIMGEVVSRALLASPAFRALIEQTCA